MIHAITKAAAVLIVCCNFTSVHAEVITLDNTALGAGAFFDEFAGPVPSTAFAISGVPGLTLQITNFGGTSGGPGMGDDVNSTATSMGINSVGADDLDAFDALLSEFITFRFNQAVSVTQLDFTNFELGDVFNFDGVSITNTDLTNGTTDVFDFAGGHSIAANTDFTIQATTGTIGIEGLTFNSAAVPEPSTLFGATMIAACFAAVTWRRRRSAGVVSN